jgi:multidrug efflux pump subunit AcrB
VLPIPDLILTEAFDFATPVQEEYDGSMSFYEGALLAVIVVWLFLRDCAPPLSRPWHCRCR